MTVNIMPVRCRAAAILALDQSPVRTRRRAICVLDRELGIKSGLSSTFRGPGLVDTGRDDWPLEGAADPNFQSRRAYSRVRHPQR